jgi:hypothetical protein
MIILLQLQDTDKAERERNVLFKDTVIVQHSLASVADK